MYALLSAEFLAERNFSTEEILPLTKLVA